MDANIEFVMLLCENVGFTGWELAERGRRCSFNRDATRDGTGDVEHDMGHVEGG